MRYPALDHSTFRAFLFAGFVSNIGTWLQNVGRTWAIYHLTGGDPRWLGWLGLSFAVPMVLLPPIGGWIVDRSSRIKLLVVTQSLLMVFALVLAWLAWTATLRPWHLLASTFVGASVLAVDNPNRQTITPDLVPRVDLLNALSLNAASFSAAALIGPAVAGVLLARFGVALLFLLNGVSFLGMLAVARTLGSVPQRVQRRESPLKGFANALRTRTVRTLLIVALIVAVCGRWYPQFLPVFAETLWHRGPSGYGSALAATGAGALFAGLGRPFLSLQPSSRVLRVSLAILAAALIAMASTSNYFMGLIALTVGGAAATMTTTELATLLQSAVAPDRRGQVMSIFVVTLIGLPQLVAPIVGPALGGPRDAISRLRWGVVAGSLVLVATAAFLATSCFAKAREAESS